MIDNFTDTELTNEVWRDIDGYDGMYQVSDLGRVRSLKYGEVRVLKPQKDNKGGYLRVNLHRDGKLKHFLVHRLVAQAFIPNDDETKTQINHRNQGLAKQVIKNGLKEISVEAKLQTSIGNFPAQNLYQKLGFKQTEQDDKLVYFSLPYAKQNVNSKQK